MSSKFSSLHVLAPLLWLLNVNAANLPSNFTSTNCASPNGFNACFGKAQTKADQCISADSGSDAVGLACTCVMWLEEINCAASNCWNEVYSCQYQSLIINYMQICPPDPTGNFPYFPAPDNAPGGCSCNIGEVYLNAKNSLTEAATKCKTTQSIAESAACFCCMESSALTSIYGLCPSTDPSLIGLQTLESDLAPFQEPFGECGSYFGQYDCIKDFGFSSVGTVSLISSIPSVTGTETLYTTGAQITTPVSGDVLTWSHASVQYTASAVNAVQTSGQTTASGGAGSTSGTTSATAHTGKASKILGHPDLVKIYSMLGLGAGMLMM